MTVTVLTGDCRDFLATMADQTYHCCVTSPPYFGLRDYGTGEWLGGDPSCRHKVGEIRTGAGMTELGAHYRGGGIKATEPKPIMARHQCPHCGAVRVDRQIGLESSVDEYVATMVDVFREVRRVLRDDGTLWLNLGDSYASGGRATYRSSKSENKGQNVQNDMPRPKDGPGVKSKDLLGVPWRVAFALQADGWYLRQDIIWHKPNPMPESVRDRCTKAHEYIFLMSKSERYYYDQGAILEPSSPNTHARLSQNVQAQIGSARANGGTRQDRPMKAVARKTAAAGSGIKNNDSFDSAMAIMPAQRNKRSVWTVATEAFSEAHFATFPPALIEPCIKAGCPTGGTVLDPFGGAGTTGLVADRLGRNAVLFELNPAYAEMARNRILADAPLLNHGEAPCQPEAASK